MKYYEKLLELGCFTRDELKELTGSDEAWFGIRKNVV